MPTVAEIIEIAEISQFLCQNDIQKKGLYGGGIELMLPTKIYNIRRSVQWMYGIDSTEESLTATSNYLYALCAPYNQEAAYIMNNGSGGSVSPASSSYYSYVKRTYSITSDSTSFFNADFVGAKDLSIFLDNQPLLTEDVDYSFDDSTGVITGITFQFFSGSSLTATFNKKFNA